MGVNLNFALFRNAFFQPAIGVAVFSSRRYRPLLLYYCTHTGHVESASVSQSASHPFQEGGWALAIITKQCEMGGNFDFLIRFLSVSLNISGRYSFLSWPAAITLLCECVSVWGWRSSSTVFYIGSVVTYDYPLFQLASQSDLFFNNNFYGNYKITQVFMLQCDLPFTRICLSFQILIRFSGNLNKQFPFSI